MTRMAARGRYDYTLLTVLGILVLSGLIILYSTSRYLRLVLVFWQCFLLHSLIITD